jgi:hypothetical protein
MQTFETAENRSDDRGRKSQTSENDAGQSQSQRRKQVQLLSDVQQTKHTHTKELATTTKAYQGKVGTIGKGKGASREMERQKEEE